MRSSPWSEATKHRYGLHDGRHCSIRARITLHKASNNAFRSHIVTWAEVAGVGAANSAPAEDVPATLETAEGTPSEKAPESAPQAQQPPGVAKFQVACPICLTTEFPLERQPAKFDNLTCARCNRTFASEQAYINLTLQSNKPSRYYSDTVFVRESTFQSPFVSFAYERGWRSRFASMGFPGEVKETKMAMEFFKPMYGEPLMDLSCASGLFTRRLAKAYKFPVIYGVDFSDAMLRQASDYIGADSSIPPDAIILVQADVARLPFRTATLGAIHAGAAMHCWGNPRAGVAEIARVLKPGGVFVGSTFMTWESLLGQLVGDEATRPLALLNQNNTTGLKLWRQDELQELLDSVGLVDIQFKRKWGFIMWSARKPSA